jgi:hypothetical protein
LEAALAVRTLEGEDGSPDVTLELYPPSQAIEDDESALVAKGDWLCRFRILHGPQVVFEDLATGPDALQAIVNAITRLKAQFDRSGLKAHYDEYSSGTGLPPYIPQGLGKDFDRRLEQLVAAEVEVRVRELEAAESSSG